MTASRLACWRVCEYVINKYDANDMVKKQTLVDEGTYQFAYTLDTNGNVAQTDVTDPRGYQRTVEFNPDGYMSSDINAVGSRNSKAPPITGSRAPYTFWNNMVAVHRYRDVVHY